MLELENVRKVFTKRGPLGGVQSETVAVRGISLSLAPGRVVGVIGESGSGKSTLARIALRLIDADTGHVRFRGRDMTGLARRALKQFRREVQPVFQDSAGALDSRMSVARILSEPLVLRADIDSSEFDDRIALALTSVDLRLDLLSRRPLELSGGQRQRVGIARALLMEPSVFVLDEPVSALDVSVQAQVLNLLLDLKEAKGLSYLFIGHDLAVADYFCDEILVMQNGTLVEFGPAEQVLSAPKDAYTQALVAAMPRAL